MSDIVLVFQFINLIIDIVLLVNILSLRTMIVQAADSSVNRRHAESLFEKVISHLRMDYDEDDDVFGGDMDKQDRKESRSHTPKRNTKPIINDDDDDDDEFDDDLSDLESSLNKPKYSLSTNVDTNPSRKMFNNPQELIDYVAIRDQKIYDGQLGAFKTVKSFDMDDNNNLLVYFENGTYSVFMPNRFGEGTIKYIL